MAQNAENVNVISFYLYLSNAYTKNSAMFLVFEYTCRDRKRGEKRVESRTSKYNNYILTDRVEVDFFCLPALCAASAFNSFNHSHLYLLFLLLLLLFGYLLLLLL